MQRLTVRTYRQVGKQQESKATHLSLQSLMNGLVQTSQSGLCRVVVHSFVLQFSYVGNIKHQRLIIVEFFGLRIMVLRQWSARSWIASCVKLVL